MVKLVGTKEIVEILAGRLSWADLQTLMMFAYEKRIRALSVAEVSRNHNGNRLSEVANVDPRDLLAVDQLLYRSLPEAFLPLELSPVNSIGANYLLAGVDPKIVLDTIRNVEVVGDSSLVLALECAKRRKRDCRSKQGGENINLATSHRSLRLQMFAKDSGLTPHFRSFALASAGRDTDGFNNFELSSIFLHIDCWLDFLSRAGPVGYEVKEISVIISDVRIMEKLMAGGKIEREEVRRRTKDPSFAPFRQYGVDLPGIVETIEGVGVTYPDLETNINEMKFTEGKLVKPIKVKYPKVRFLFDLERCSGVGYYSGLCYKVSAKAFDGGTYSVAGGGACDWTRKLLQSKREHLIASGFGTESFVRKFKVC